MNIVDLLFYADAFLIIGCAVIAVMMRHLLHAALALMMSLFCTAGLFLLLGAEFAALVQLMVYIGGVVIFIVYTILLTAHLGEDMPRASIAKRVASMLAALAFGALLYIVHLHGGAAAGPFTESLPEGTGGLHDIGRRLLSREPDGFVIPFEIVSLLLLAAMIGAVSIARRSTPEEENE